MREFKGKTAVITGGASGIGFALANQAALRQMNVVLADIETEALEHAIAHFEDRQVPVLGVETDTRMRESIDNLFNQATARFGNVHLLFNNAGVVNGGGPMPVWELPDEDWDWVMGVNFYGVLHGVRAFTPHMVAHGESGHIVNTASIAAFIPGSGPYGVSKHGVVILSEALARDLAETAIGASVVCPGWVNTNISDAERNRPDGLKSRANPDGQGLGLNALLGASKSPEALAGIVFDAIENDNFYIFPHPGWDYMLRDHTAAMLARSSVYQFDMEAHVATREAGEDI